MSVLVDKQIRERVKVPNRDRLHGWQLLKIDPFVDYGGCPEGVISYGLSSGGYDVRVGTQFLLFSNTAACIVDPKNFRRENFTEVNAEVGEGVVIPPNCFALADTVEYIEMPRDLIAEVKGKCVTGDTRIVDAQSGLYKSIVELSNISKTVSMIRNRLVQSRVSGWLYQGRREVFLIKTDMGREIKATANHPFYKASKWTELKDLVVGDRIATPGNIPVFGMESLPVWEAALLGFMVSEGSCTKGPSFTTADSVLGDAVTDFVWAGLGCLVSRQNKKYNYSLVNKRGTGGIPRRNRAEIWLESHGLFGTYAHTKFVPDAVFRSDKDSVKTFLRALFSGDGSVYSVNKSCCIEYSTISKRLAEDVRHLLLRFGIVSAIGFGKKTSSYRIRIYSKNMMQRFASEIGFWPKSIKQVRLEELIGSLKMSGARRKQREKWATLPMDGVILLRKAISDAGLKRGWGAFGTGAANRLSVVAVEKATKKLGLTGWDGLIGGELVWDRIKSIEYYGVEDVYDIEVPDGHSFVANDLIVHNSRLARGGYIMASTPIEPAWRGKITLEIGNLSPLPMKVYAGEGIGQLVFYKLDTLPEKDYDQKPGKRFQDQKGLTGPEGVESGMFSKEGIEELKKQYKEIGVVFGG